jgi:hypothetical protein
MTKLLLVFVATAFASSLVLHSLFLTLGVLGLFPPDIVGEERVASIRNRIEERLPWAFSRYERRLRQTTIDITRRFARGDVVVQTGFILTSEDLWLFVEKGVPPRWQSSRAQDATYSRKDA